MISESKVFVLPLSTFYGSTQLRKAIPRLLWGIQDISFLEALLRILTLAADRMKSIGSYCQRTFDAFFFVAMDVALNTLGISKNRSISFSVNPES